MKEAVQVTPTVQFTTVVERNRFVVVANHSASEQTVPMSVEVVVSIANSYCIGTLNIVARHALLESPTLSCISGSINFVAINVTDIMVISLCMISGYVSEVLLVAKEMETPNAPY